MRDRRSDALIQSWPFLDYDRGVLDEFLVAPPEDPYDASALGVTSPRKTARKGANLTARSGTVATATALALATDGRAIHPSAICTICQARAGTRVCYDCPPAAHATSMGMAVPPAYCFACYSVAHAEDPELKAHRYDEVVGRDGGEDGQESPVKQGERGPLMCTVCDQPATRQCLGILDDAQIDALCGALQVRKRR